MLNKKIIICEKCKYFPNRADQIKHQGIKILSDRIEWQCEVCRNENVYFGSQTIVLPETTLSTFKSQNLLKNKEKNEETCIGVFIDLDSFNTRQPIYYCPKYKEQIENICGVQYHHLKDIQALEKQSSWLVKYRSFLHSFSKMSNKINDLSRGIVLEDYLIYILELFICLQGQKKERQIKISLSKHGVSYSFQINLKRTGQNVQLINFLKIYAIHQFDIHDAWLSKLYKKLLEKYTEKHQNIAKFSQILFIGKRTDMKINDQLKQVFFLQVNGEENTNIFSINPLGHNPFVNHIQQIKKTNQTATTFSNDTIFIFFKKEGIKTIFKDQLSLQLISSLKSSLLNSHIMTIDKQQMINKQLKKYLRAKQPNSKIKLVKMYCRLFINDQQKIILFTFNWHKIQKDLVEELDDQVQEQHQLKEDILSQSYIKLQAPSPFLKKNSRQTCQLDRQNVNAQDDEEYL